MAEEYRNVTEVVRFDVFLSHSVKDKAMVRDVAERLRKGGVKVWFDEWVFKPGDSTPTKIEEGLSARACWCSAFRRMRSARTRRSWSPARYASATR
jgi:TIR domain